MKNQNFPRSIFTFLFGDVFGSLFPLIFGTLRASFFSFFGPKARHREVPFTFMLTFSQCALPSPEILQKWSLKGPQRCHKGAQETLRASKIHPHRSPKPPSKTTRLPAYNTTKKLQNHKTTRLQDLPPCNALNCCWAGGITRSV